jgi:hypothetical protein
MFSQAFETSSNSEIPNETCTSTCKDKQSNNQKSREIIGPGKHQDHTIFIVTGLTSFYFYRQVLEQNEEQLRNFFRLTVDFCRIQLRRESCRAFPSHPLWTNYPSTLPTSEPRCRRPAPAE